MDDPGEEIMSSSAGFQELLLRAHLCGYYIYSHLNNHRQIKRIWSVYESIVPRRIDLA
jgi:hypothetical protein